MHGAGSAASAKAQVDWSCAYKAKADILQYEIVCANAAKMPPEAWYEMYVEPWHRSAHGHIHTKICNKLGPETTEKLVYVYSNSKMAATVRDADELKMFAWDNEDV